MASKLITQTAESLQPGGRANAMQAIAVRMFRDSMLSLVDGVYLFLKGIYGDLWGATMREDAVIQWEKQFGLSPAPTDTLAERANAIEQAWELTGYCGPGYIEAKLQALGFNVTVRENLPVANLSSLITDVENPFAAHASALQFAAHATAPQFQTTQNYFLGNGFLLNTDGTETDPYSAPLGGGAPTETQFAAHASALQFAAHATAPEFGSGVSPWSYVFVIEGLDGGYAEIPTQRRKYFETAILRLKPAHLGVFIRARYM